MTNLKVKNPEKYGFTPRNLLGKIVSVALAFSSNESVIKALASYVEKYPRKNLWSFF
jgi:hypothetical protein